MAGVSNFLLSKESTALLSLLSVAEQQRALIAFARPTHLADVTDKNMFPKTGSGRLVENPSLKALHITETEQSVTSL